MPLLFPTPNLPAPKAIAVNGKSERSKKRPRDSETKPSSSAPTAGVAEQPKHKPKKPKKVKAEQKAASDSLAQASNGSHQPKPAKKGDLQSQLKSKLAGGRFRMLNAALYTSSGQQGKDLMSDKEAFDAYHEGFRAQAANWPLSPVKVIAQSLRSLPKRSLVVDIGCGDAALAQGLVPQGIKVVSFDLLKENDWVAEAEGGKLPLPGPSGAVVDAAVCCLSLMPTDWIRFIEEAARVLVDDGSLKIAEVASRFPDVDEFVSIIEQVGFSLVDKDLSNTHFSLFTFKRKGFMSVLEEADRERSESLLTPCHYKKR